MTKKLEKKKTPGATRTRDGVPPKKGSIPKLRGSPGPDKSSHTTTVLGTSWEPLWTARLDKWAPRLCPPRRPSPSNTGAPSAVVRDDPRVQPLLPQNRAAQQRVPTSDCVAAWLRQRVDARHGSINTRCRTVFQTSSSKRHPTHTWEGEEKRGTEEDTPEPHLPCATHIFL